MTQNEFVKVTEELDKMANDILMGKGKEYASDFDRLANFKDIGKKFKIDPRVVLWVYLEKHLRSLNSTLVEGKISIESHTRIADCINYLKLLYALEYEMAGEDADENVAVEKPPLGKIKTLPTIIPEGTSAHEEISRLVTKLIVATDTVPLQKRNNWFYTVIGELQKQIDFNTNLEAKVKADADFYNNNNNKVITADEYIPDTSHYVVFYNTQKRKVEETIKFISKQEANDYGNQMCLKYSNLQRLVIPAIIYEIAGSNAWSNWETLKTLVLEPTVGKDNNDKPMHGSELIR